jgi:transposase
MFVRTVKAKGHRYVRIVENYREGGRLHQRVVANLGNVKLCQKDLVQVIEGLRQLVEKVYVTEEEIEPQNGSEYGRITVGIWLWRQLGFEEVLSGRFARTRVKEVGSVYAQCMVLNRLCDPESKLGIFRWLEDVYLPGWGLPRVLEKEEQKEYAERFYRTLDYLERWKEGLEKELYVRVRDLFHLRVDVVFYDVTSSYFEGAGARGLGKRGYSRDGHPQDKQVVIGLVLCQGLPIAHHIFEGNRTDITTVKEVAKDLKERFQIGRFVFVGDRGMVSEEIIEFLEEEGIDYVVALRRRECRETAKALEVDVDETWEDLGCVRAKELVVEADTFVRDEWGLASKEGRRLVLCYNEERAGQERQKRRDKMDKLRPQLEALCALVNSGKLKNPRTITERATRILSRRKGSRYFNWNLQDGRFEFSEDKRKLAYEEKLDGKFVLLCRTKSYWLSTFEVVETYKDLWEIEWAFRDLKSFIELRPMRHYKDNRVRGHVQICVWALLTQRVLQKRLDQAGIGMTSRMALESLRTIKVVETQVGQKKITFVTPPNPRNQGILNALGLGLPRVLVEEAL